MTPSTIHGDEFVNCNCAYGCGCQFNALPTHGDCQAIATYRIDRGSHGDTSLDGLCGAAIYRWPGPVHEGNGEMQLVIDERADADQRRALETIMSGGADRDGRLSHERDRRRPAGPRLRPGP